MTSPSWTMRLPERSSGSSFAAFFPPQPQQGAFVLAHDDPGIGAADEVSPIQAIFTHKSFHDHLVSPFRYGRLVLKAPFATAAR